MAWRSGAATRSTVCRLAEGVATAAIAARITRERDIDAPIIAAIDYLLRGAITVDEAVSNLMTRPLRAEDE